MRPACAHIFTRCFIYLHITKRRETLEFWFKYFMLRSFDNISPLPFHKCVNSSLHCLQISKGRWFFEGKVKYEQFLVYVLKKPTMTELLFGPRQARVATVWKYHHKDGFTRFTWWVMKNYHVHHELKQWAWLAPCGSTDYMILCGGLWVPLHRMKSCQRKSWNEWSVKYDNKNFMWILKNDKMGLADAVLS